MELRGLHRRSHHHRSLRRRHSLHSFGRLAVCGRDTEEDVRGPGTAGWGATGKEGPGNRACATRGPCDWALAAKHFVECSYRPEAMFLCATMSRALQSIDTKCAS